MKITRIGFYSTSENRSEDLFKISESISESWFQKTNMSGTIGEVTKIISEQPVPDNLIFFASAATGDALLAELDSLAEVCDPSTLVYIFSAEREVRVYRKILSLGVTGCEGLPVDEEFVSSEIRKYLSLESNGRLILGAAILPGVGFSTAMMNIASRCAHRLGDQQSVALIDGDYTGGISNLYVADKLRSHVQFDEKTGSDVFAGSIIPQGSKWNNFHVFPTPSRLLGRRTVSDRFIENGLPDILKKCDYTFFDFGSFDQLWNCQAVDYCDQIFIASRPTLNGIRLLRELVQNILDTRGAIEKIVCMLIGEGRNSKNEINSKKILEILPNIDVFHLPDMPGYVFSGESTGSLVFDTKRGKNKYEKAIDSVCDAIIH